MKRLQPKASRELLILELVLMTVLCLPIACSRAPRVEWSRHYGGEGEQIGLGVAATSDGGYILAGSTDVNERKGRNALVLRTDHRGDTLWMRAYGTSDDEYAYAVFEAADGGYVVAGNTLPSSKETGQMYVWLMRLSEDGDSLWTRTYMGPEGHSFQLGSVIATKDGGYAMVGPAQSLSEKNVRAYVIKTDELGFPVWSVSCVDSNLGSGRDIAEISSGGYILTGNTPFVRGAALPQISLTRIGVAGDLVFSKTYRPWPTGVCHGRSCLETKEHRFLVCATVRREGDGKVLLILTDGDGEVIWTREYSLSSKHFTPDSQLHSAWAKASPPDGFTVYGTGLRQGRGIDSEKIVFLIEVDSQGEVRWTKYLRESNYWYYASLDRGANGEYILGGTTFVSRSPLGGQAQIITLSGD